ncbi:MAG: nuclear transport factor 2 family protein [Planctomycetes bacterium]|nr:nuclear transport factor 2 family protein [Planctomycetota bacterium]
MSPEAYLHRKNAARANRAFYDALERCDLDALRTVWLDDPSVKCIHPGGELIIGPERVLESWRVVFENSKPWRFEILDLDLEVTGELAWASHVERLHVTVESGILIAESAATNLYVRREEEWKMVLHHASPIARRFFEE